MKTKLITFGDSWPEGAELNSDERAFGYILADFLNVDVYENYAVGSSSLNSTIYYLNRYIKTHEKIDDYLTLAVFHFPSTSRMMFLNSNGEPMSYKVPPVIDHYSIDPAHIWYKYFHNAAQDTYCAQTSLVTLQAMCKSVGIQDFYMSTYPLVDLSFPGIDIQRVYPKSTLEIFGLQQNELEISNHWNNKYIYPNMCHPNQQGHKLIADTLYNWMRDMLKSDYRFKNYLSLDNK